MPDFFVKICGITNETDALAAVAMGADVLGFIFAPSARKVSVATVTDIVRRLPDGVTTIGVFKDADRVEVVETIEATGLAGAQLHGNETAEEIAFIRDFVSIVIKAGSSQRSEMKKFDNSLADYLLVDGNVPGSGVSHDFGDIFSKPMEKPLIAAGGLTPLNVAGVARELPIVGVDVASGVERSPGIKDAALMAEFISAAQRGFSERTGA